MSHFRMSYLGTAVAAMLATVAPAQAHDHSQNGQASARSPHAQAETLRGHRRDAARLRFERIATLPVFLNTDANLETVAEILDVSRDGRTLVYTDSETGNLGFIDIGNPDAPRVDGVLAMGGEPTSVAVARRYALAAINTSADFTNPSGHLNVVDMHSRAIVASIDLGGQPDSVAVSPDGRYAAVVIENERDEDIDVGGVEGGLPQLPGGALVIVDMRGNPSHWSTRRVDLAGLADIAPADPEPEYVDINRNNIAAVTLQENNHLVFVDLGTGEVVNHFNLGDVGLSRIDTLEDDVIRLDGSLSKVKREPDAVTWIDRHRVALANEGDLEGGSRGFSIFSLHGDLEFDSGNGYEHLAVRHGHYPENRSENKGAEPEGIEHARFGANEFLFVGSERGNFVAVYELGRDRTPEFVQLLPVTNGPEGLKAIPHRGLFVVASEVDDADEGIRSTVAIFKLQRGPASYPTLVSDDDAHGNPIPWGALSGLAGDSEDAHTLYTVHDSFYREPRLYRIDVSAQPARISASIPLSGCGACDYDLEGIALNPDGGFWLASEGRTGVRRNLLIRTAADGSVLEEVELPASVRAQSRNNGFEGVAVTGSGAGQQVYVAFQREWKDDSSGRARIGRYTPETAEWAFFHYPLDAVESPAGGWVGLSELSYLGHDTFAVIERDNRRGLDAAVKRLYTFSVAGQTPVAQGGSFPVLTKTLAHDLLPDLQAPNGWVQDKAEGLAVAADGQVYMVTDNDGVDEATGETQFRHLGERQTVLGQ